MSKQEKIELYREVLSADSGSKLFFKLAVLYAEEGRNDEARVVLEQGLEKHPEYLEARLMLIEILARMDQEDKAVEEVEAVTRTLTRYTSFWKLWAARGADTRDFALALAFITAALEGVDLSWSDLLSRGLDSLAGAGGGRTVDLKRRRRIEDMQDERRLRRILEDPWM